MADAYLPFALTPTTRGTGTGDRRAVNVLPEPIVDPITQQPYYAVFKRAGLAASTQPPGGSAAARGVYHWDATGNIYSVFANKIYSGASDLGVTLAGSTGKCWFTDTPATSNEQILIISDGSDHYHITTGDSITKYDENDDANFPQSTLGPIHYIDGYILSSQSSGKVWNTGLGTFSTWAASNFFSANAVGDALKGTALIKDRLIAFGSRSTEMHWNRGNPYGSPFFRQQQNLQRHGIASINTLAQVGDVLCYVGETPAGGDGGRSVWMMMGLESKELSNPVINRFLSAEGTSISSATAWIERISGHLVYVLNLASADRTFVYDITSGAWAGEWEAAAGSAKFPAAYATSKAGVIYLQDAANGRIYTASDTTYQDNSTTFTVTLQTEPSNYGTEGPKSFDEIHLDADLQASGTATLTLSNDEGANDITLGTFDLTSTHKVIRDCGTYQGKVRLKLTHAQNTAARFQGLRVFTSVGTY